MPEPHKLPADQQVTEFNNPIFLLIDLDERLNGMDF